MTDEQLALEIKERHGLSSLHLFDSSIAGLEWRVFGYRRDAKGFQASVESGGGPTIREALDTLNERLTAGPIAKRHIPFLDAEPSVKNCHD